MAMNLPAAVRLTAPESLLSPCRPLRLREALGQG